MAWAMQIIKIGGWIFDSFTGIWTFTWNWDSGESVICFYILSHKIWETDHDFVFFGYKVSIQQHFQSHLFWKTKPKCQEAENSCISSEPCSFMLQKSKYQNSEIAFLEAIKIWRYPGKYKVRIFHNLEFQMFLSI